MFLANINIFFFITNLVPLIETEITSQNIHKNSQDFIGNEQASLLVGSRLIFFLGLRVNLERVNVMKD